MTAAFLAALVLAASPAPAVEIAVVDAAQVHAALVGGQALLVDARPPAEYERAHIVNAINIPAERTKAEAARLPRDRRTPIVFYCRGAG
ncbi:MAG TPA: rhodanese-like domain-containing protein [Anaeromyxobacter sp.]